MPRSHVSVLGSQVTNEQACLFLVVVRSALYLGMMYSVRFGGTRIHVGCVWGDSTQHGKPFGQLECLN